MNQNDSKIPDLERTLPRRFASASAIGATILALAGCQDGTGMNSTPEFTAAEITYELAGDSAVLYLFVDAIDPDGPKEEITLRNNMRIPWRWRHGSIPHYDTARIARDPEDMHLRELLFLVDGEGHQAKKNIYVDIPGTGTYQLP